MSLGRTYSIGECEPKILDDLLANIRLSSAVVSENFDSATRTLTVLAQDEDALRYIDTLVADEKRIGRKLKRKVLYKNRGNLSFQGDIDADLAHEHNVCWMGSGLAGLRGVLLDLYRFFETEFIDISREFHAEEHHYPVMLPLEVLEEVNYFHHFPQQLTFCSHLPEDFALFEGLSETERSSAFWQTLERMGAPGFALKPAVCIPCYRQYRGLRLPNDRHFAVTMQNHVFRYEGANFRSLARLWDFSVRDIVFFGMGKVLETLRISVMERAIALCRELDLDAQVQLANDPFFLNGSREKKLYQRMGEVKFELVLTLPRRREELAVASFNLHRDFYSGVYNMQFTSGGLIETACMGFGIERWIYGLLSQKGLDINNWPIRIREFVSRRTWRSALGACGPVAV